jgi:hypothetical protein
MNRRRVLPRLLLLAAAACASTATAQSLQWHGYLDLRLVDPPAARSGEDGGEGRLRHGRGDRGAQVQAALVASWQATPSLLARAQLQAGAEEPADLIEAWLRWRPVSTTPRRWSLQGGLFFPPISLEHDGIGWTNRWTLTSSALNSWVGEELRGIGVAASHEWRGATQALSATVALFGGNDPAGEILFARGWSLTDRVCGLQCRLREPDAMADALGEPRPRRFDPYVEIDDRLGAYAGLEWSAPGRGRLRLLRYHNNADGSTNTHYRHSEIYTWETRFWSLGGETSWGDTTLLAQAMRGDTYFAPSAAFRSRTDFDAAYVLLGWERGEWRPALRLDWFRTREHPSLGQGSAEHGRAFTFALNWRPRPWLRLTGELLRLDGTRHAPDYAVPTRPLGATQLQLNARLLF